jgi:hypothetical protein
MVTIITATHYALAKKKRVEKNAVKVSNGLKTLIAHARVVFSAVRTTLGGQTLIASAIRKRSVAKDRTDATMSFAFRPWMKSSAAQVRNILETQAAHAKTVPNIAARVILTQTMRTVLVTLKKIAAIRHPSSKHGGITPNTVLRVTAATNAVLMILLTPTNYVIAYHKNNAVRAKLG